MRKILMINVLCLVSLTTLLGQTVENRIAPPVNYIRETCDEHSFTSSSTLQRTGKKKSSCRICRNRYGNR